MTEARSSTAIHEAAHAVVSYALGRRLMGAVVFNDSTGEVLTQCSGCETCKKYYYWHDPAKDPHSKNVQDDYRCDMAIAMVGGISERAFFDNSGTNDKGELRQDEELTWSRAQAVHRWSQSDCWGSPEVPCQACESYIASMKSAVEKIVGTPLIEKCIRELGEELESCQRMDEKAIDQFLCERCLERGSALGSLPAAPEDNRPDWTGLVTGRLTLRNPRLPNSDPVEVLAWAGSGALHLHIPECLQTQLRLEAIGTREITGDDGTRRVVPYVGPIELRFKNRVGFGGALVTGDQVLLGSMSMEDMDLSIIPITRTLDVNPDNPNFASSFAK